MSPTQRSLKLLREQGYKPWIVEHLAIQTTSRGNVAARQKKIVENEYYPEMVRSGWKVQVHGWGKLKDGWQVKIIELN
jgi:hypothetical protein